jgi:hypothetical protein
MFAIAHVSAINGGLRSGVTLMGVLPSGNDNGCQQTAIFRRDDAVRHRGDQLS